MEQSYPKVKSFWWYALFLTAILAGLTWLAVFSLRPDYLLRVDFFDVGQGDAAFITTFQGNQILIDGGPNSTVLQRLGRAMPFYDRTIDLLVLTHPHADHLTGLVEVLKRYKVKYVLLTGVDYSSAIYRELLKLMEGKKIDKVWARAGLTARLDDATVLKVLLPSQEIKGQTYKDLNESSLVLKLDFGRSHFLFMGDASRDNENELLASGQNVSAEVLKIGHHGSKNSTSLGLLEASSPDYAIISAGKNNRYGHPHQETLDSLQSFGIKVFRTDLNGDVRFISDGKDLEFNN